MGDRSLQEYTERRQRMYDKMSDAWKRMLKGLAERIRKVRQLRHYNFEFGPSACLSPPPAPSATPLPPCAISTRPDQVAIGAWNPIRCCGQFGGLQGRRWIFYTSASFFPGGVNGNGKPMQMYLNMAPMAMDGAVASYGGEPTFAQFTCEEPISKSTLTPAGKVQVDGLAMVDTLFDGDRPHMTHPCPPPGWA